ncbi:hypothetical protein ACFLS1_09115 [Verrucomicrobiota bacterium]
MISILASRWADYAVTMLWQSSLVMICIWLLYLLCRRCSSILRYSLLCLILVKLLLPTGLHSVTGVGHWANVLQEKYAVKSAITQEGNIPVQPNVQTPV